MLHTTFRKAREAKACVTSYCKMADALGGISKYGVDTPIPLDKVLEVCGLDDTIWALRIVIESADREIRLLAYDYAERILPLYEKEYPNDKKPRQAIEIARKFADGQATDEELVDAWIATGAAGASARAAAWIVTGAAGAAARDAGAAARDVAGAGARDAEREWQREKLLEMLGKSP